MLVACWAAVHPIHHLILDRFLGLLDSRVGQIMAGLSTRPPKVSYLLRYDSEKHESSHRLGVNSLAVHPSGVLTAGRDAHIGFWSLDADNQVKMHFLFLYPP